MSEYAKKPEKQPRTLETSPKTSGQAPLSEILQAYQNRTLVSSIAQRKNTGGSDARMPGKFETIQKAKGDEKQEPSPEGHKEEEGDRGYLHDLRETNRWGGEPEAHAIAAHFEFTTRIYRKLVDIDNPATYTAVGNGPPRDLYLYWNGNHYQVINPTGAVVHNPVGDGNCLFEAMFFIVRGGAVQQALEDPLSRAVRIRGMRSYAATWLEGQPDLLGVLEHEYEEEQNDQTSLSLSVDGLQFLAAVYKNYPPKRWYVEHFDDYDYFRIRKGDPRSRYRTDYYINKYVKDNAQDVRAKTEKFTGLLLNNAAYREHAKEETKVATEDSGAGRFAQKYPAAVRIKPQDLVKECIKDTVFKDHMTFISSAFKTESLNLPRFDGHVVYHDTQGGGKGGFTVFGVIVDEDRFLIASGHHFSGKEGKYQIDWSCAPEDAIWGVRKTVAFGKTAGSPPKPGPGPGTDQSAKGRKKRK